MLLPCYTGMNERLLYFTGSYTCYCSATEEPIHELLLWFRGIYTATALIQRNLHVYCSDTEESTRPLLWYRGSYTRLLLWYRRSYTRTADRIQKNQYVLLLCYRRSYTCCYSATEEASGATTWGSYRGAATLLCLRLHEYTCCCSAQLEAARCWSSVAGAVPSTGAFYFVSATALLNKTLHVLPYCYIGSY